MTKDEALKLALEALDIGLDYARDEQFENARRYAGHERLAPDDAFLSNKLRTPSPPSKKPCHSLSMIGRPNISSKWICTIKR